MINMELGVHDLVTLNDSETPEAAYERTKRFIQDVEKLNYKRYWFAEHHNSPNNISTSPELMAAHMTALTNKIRIGTGGTMIMHYSPLKIAENFKTLITLAPGRIDLGLGRAPGSGVAELIALAQGNPDTKDDQYGKIDAILKYLLDEKASGIYGETNAQPQGTSTLPEPWMLGSSGQSAEKAAELGLGYSFAKFFGIETNPDIFNSYRNLFKPSRFFAEPSVMVSYFIAAADSKEEADYIAKPLELSRLASKARKTIKNLHPEEVKDYKFTNSEQNILNHYYDKRYIVKGNPAEVQNILEQEIELYGIDELMVYAPLFDYEARYKSYQHVAKMFGKIH